MQVGPAYRPIRTEYLEYDNVIKKYERMMDWLAHVYLNALHAIQYMHDRYYYEAAEMALSEGRDVYAIPGSIYSPQSSGCHNLIRAGARLVESPQEILEEMRLVEPPKRSAREQLTPEEAHIYRVLSFDHALSMDEIIDSMPEHTAENIPLLLLQMQLKGIITENERHAYRRVERN